MAGDPQLGGDEIMVRIAAWALLGSFLGFAAQGQEARERIQLGKSATAFVDLGDRGSGSAVCIDASGIFITNHHVIQGLATDATVKLVVEPNSAAPRVVQARALRQDEKWDLAVLKVAEGDGKPFAALQLGDDSKLFETMSVTAFGFPFGKLLAGQGRAYPEISVNVGRVTSLRQNDGKLERIQLDAQLNPGNSGGPVIDDSGAIVGIVHSGVRGAGVNFAVPVSRLKDLLARPEILFRPAPIPFAKIREEAEFKIEVIPFLRTPGQTVVMMEIRTEGQAARMVTAESKGNNQYVAKAVPIPAIVAKEAAWLPGTATFAKGSLSGEFRDQQVEVGAASMKLSEIRSIEGGTNSRVVRRDGTVLPGAAKGLENVTVELGGLKILVDLSMAKRLELGATDPPDPRVTFAIIILTEGREISRKEGTLTLERAPSPAFADNSGPAPEAPRFAPYVGERKTIELPDQIADAVVGRAGRLLLLHLKKTRKIAVYDVNEAKIVKWLSIAAGNGLVVAGMDKMIVVAPNENLVERWSLDTFEKETTRQLGLGGIVKAVALGSASKGPLLVHWAESTDELARCQYAFFSIDQFERLKVEPFTPNNTSYRDFVHIRASGTGDLFGLWCTSHSPQGMETLTLLGNKVRLKYQHNSVGHIVPTMDGRAILTGIAGLCSPELNQQQGSRNGRTLPTIPSTHARFYISVPAEPGAQINLGQDPFAGNMGGVYSLGLESRLADLPPLDLGRPTENHSWSADDFTVDKRVLFVPQANQIVSIPFTNDKLIVQRFNLREALDKKDVDYLYVTSVAPRTIRKGETYRYAIEVASRGAGLEYELNSGPPGMSVNKAGIVEWLVPADFKEDRIHVIITIRNDKGQSLYESFELRF